MADHQTAIRAALRDRMCRRRASVPDRRQRAGAAAIVDRLVAFAVRGRWTTVLAYVAHAGELDPAAAVDGLLDLGITVGLPRVHDRDLSFHRMDGDDSWESGAFGILTPPAWAPTVTPADADAVLVPLVGFDDQGNRLGMGGGFYDRLLADATRPLRIGLAHDGQRVARLPVQAWDQHLDGIVTPTMTLWTTHRSAADAHIRACRRP